MRSTAPGTAVISAGNVLHVTVNSASFTLQLDPTMTYSSAQLTSHIGGGTNVTLTSGAVVSSGQTVIVSTGQTSSGVTVLSSGRLVIVAGGIASATRDFERRIRSALAGRVTVSRHRLQRRRELVSSGGIASATQILSGGQDRSRPLATHRPASCRAAANKSSRPGARGAGTTVASGGQQVVAGGVASNTSDAGQVTVSSGGTTRAAAILSGGLRSCPPAASPATRR